MKRRDFVKYGTIGLCGCALGTGSFYLSKKENSKIPIFEYIEIDLVEHCNLKCKYCSHFSNIAEKSFYDVKKYEEDMEILANTMTGGKLSKLQLLGGEPLLHPQINKLIEISRKNLPDTDLDIITNGILLDEMEPEFWETLVENDVVICPTLYPININWDSILSKAKKYGVRIMNDGRDYVIEKEQTLSPIEYFYKGAFDLNGQQSTSRPKCSFNAVYSYKDGKLYRCFIASNIEHFNKKFNKNLEITENDYIDCSKINNIHELFKETDKWISNYPFCRYCPTDFKLVKWERADEHDISEWT